MFCVYINKQECYTGFLWYLIIFIYAYYFLMKYIKLINFINLYIDIINYWVIMGYNGNTL